MGKKKPALPEFDKYLYYQKSVQSPDEDAVFLAKTYTEIFDCEPTSMREDFCAAFALCCEWVKLGDENRAYAIDLDPEPLDYGKKNYLSRLAPGQQERITCFEQDVMNSSCPPVDVICALNFSYMGIKTRKELAAYFKSCLEGLTPEKGVLFIDCFGGPETHAPNVNETDHGDFSYFWDQDTYNPITNEAMFYIHFRRKGEKKRRNVFTYDWRLWDIAELRDILREVGFAQVDVYWEGTDADGDGNGEFTKTDQGDDCESWVAYLVASNKPD